MSHNSVTRKPIEDWQRELMPYFEMVFIYGSSFCEDCSNEVEFNSGHKKYSDGWWFDEAKAMKKAGWVIPQTKIAYCKECADAKNLKHNPNAYDLTSL